MGKDIHNLKQVLDNNTERYLSKLFPEDKEDVRRFADEFLAQGYSAGRIVKYLYSLASISKKLAKPFKKAGSEDTKRYVVWLEKSDYAEWTKHDLKVILRKYLQWAGREDVINWLKIKKVKNRKLPEEVLTEDDIKAIAGVAYTARDKAFILSLYESGCRIGEFLPLKLKHVSFDKYGTLFRVTGKTGDRRVRLVATTLAIQGWLNEHPAKNDPESYMWCKIPTQNNPKRKNNHLSYRFISKLLKELAVKAGIKKAVNPHAFRHARATFMASHLKEPAMREVFGWGKDSEMTAVYVHLSGRDVDDSVLAIYDIKEAKKTQEPIIRAWNCQRCGEANDPTSRYCKKCGLPVDAGNMDKLEVLLVDVLKIIGDSFPQVKEKFREVVKERGAEGLFKL